MKTTRSLNPLRIFSRIFGDIQAGEGVCVILLLTNLFLFFVGYYVLKTVREAIVGNANVKSYSSAAQALLLMGFVPLYSWLASQTDRIRLILRLILIFIGCVELFYFLSFLDLPYLGVAFFIWLGVYNVCMPAQFWSYANDLYTKEQGDRLFPIIAIGAATGAVCGPLLNKLLFWLDWSPYSMMQVAVLLLLAHLGIYLIVDKRETRKTDVQLHNPLHGKNGFALVFQSPYIRLIALLLILLNLVNTTGEYILTNLVNEMAQAAFQNLPPGTQFKPFIQNYRGAFFSDFYLWVNISGLIVQALLVSRIVRYTGLVGAMFALPVIALGAYGLVALGAGFSVLRWAKTAENASDYSIMNTAKAMFWLPTSRDEKYKAKQTVDTFFVRIGDLLSAGLVALGTIIFHFSIRWFALVNLVLIAIWLAVTIIVIRKNRMLAGQAQSLNPENTGA